MSEREKLIEWAERWNKETKLSVALDPGDEELSPGLIPTNIPSLDAILGGGFPRGRTTIFYGQESTGKTLLAQLLMASVHKRGGICSYFDVERCFSPEWFRATGVETTPDKLLIVRPRSLEQAFDMAEDMLENVAPDVLVIDSLAAMVPRDMLEAKLEDKDFMGLAARKTTEGIKKLTQVNSSTVLVVINQVRSELGVCVDPNTLVLKRDLTWVPAGDLVKGDELLVPEENIVGRGKNRQLKTAVVTTAGIKDLLAQEILLSNGEALIATPEHKWIVGGAHGSAWVPTGHLIPGKTKLKRYLRPWKYDDSCEGGYIAAAFDGEGSISLDGKVITFKQNENDMLLSVISILNSRAILYADSRFINQCENRAASLRLLGGRSAVLNFLGTFRPKRLLKKFNATCRLGGIKPIEEPIVVSVGKEHVRPMAVISTSEQTYFANGYGAHNTFGNPEKMPGGKGLRHAATIMVHTRRGQWLTEKETGLVDFDVVVADEKKEPKRVGARLKLRTTKNKLAPPYQSCEVDFKFNGEVDTVGSLVHLALQRGVITVSTSRGFYEVPGHDKKLHGLPAIKELLRSDEQLKQSIVDALKG